MIYVPFTLSIYISWYFHLCSFELFIFFPFLPCSLGLFFSFWRYLIINMNHKKILMMLGLFGYYPWHYGALDFLDLGLKTLAYVGDLMTLIDILSWVLKVYLKTLGYLFMDYLVTILGIMELWISQT